MSRVVINEQRDCGHEVNGYPLEVQRLDVPCPLCAKVSSQIVFTVKREAS